MNATDLYFNAFQKFILGNGLELNFDKSKALVKRYLTAEFARQIYGESYYYEIVLPEDAMVKRVLNQK